MAQNQIAWYANGSCPLDRLVVIATGTNSSDGTWFHRLPRATLRRWYALRQRAFKRTGRWLYISDGWATDRPYWVQVMAKQQYGKYAATPGTSSHGMVFVGLQTAAIDAGNWSWVYADHGYGPWLSDLRAEGFDRLPDGYQQEGEYHHIIDYNPWDDEPEFGGAPAGYDASPFEEDDMFTETDRKQLQATYAAMFGPANLNIPQMTWAKPFGEAPGAAFYGLLDVAIYSQGILATQAGRLAAIEEVVEQLAVGSGAVLDMDAIAAAAEKGAREAFDGLTFTAVPDA